MVRPKFFRHPVYLPENQGQAVLSRFGEEQEPRPGTRFEIQVFWFCYAYKDLLLILTIHGFLLNRGLHICMAYRSRQIGLLLISQIKLYF